MINIALTIDKRGCLKEFEAAGHAENIVCAAVTMLLRTTAKLVYDNSHIQAAGSKGDPGEMWLKIHSYNHKALDWFLGITEFCVKGLYDLQEEYPEQVLIKYVYT